MCIRWSGNGHKWEAQRQSELGKHMCLDGVDTTSIAGMKGMSTGRMMSGAEAADNGPVSNHGFLSYCSGR